jgi:hypothetical protein
VFSCKHTNAFAKFSAHLSAVFGRGDVCAPNDLQNEVFLLQPSCKMHAHILAVTNITIAVAKALFGVAKHLKSLASGMY